MMNQIRRLSNHISKLTGRTSLTRNSLTREFNNKSKKNAKLIRSEIAHTEGHRWIRLKKLFDMLGINPILVYSQKKTIKGVYFWLYLLSVTFHWCCLSNLSAFPQFSPIVHIDQSTFTSCEGSRRPRIGNAQYNTTSPPQKAVSGNSFLRKSLPGTAFASSLCRPAAKPESCHFHLLSDPEPCPRPVTISCRRDVVPPPPPRPPCPRPRLETTPSAQRGES